MLRKNQGAAAAAITLTGLQGAKTTSAAFFGSDATYAYCSNDTRQTNTTAILLSEHPDLKENMQPIEERLRVAQKVASHAGPSLMGEIPRTMKRE